ncbi:MAG: hypothetical protein QM523_11395, partial [Candidatus Pacebacteria bacterium]|nr:hypothetical protein [Candidatus Paceibacterota bacterium]
MKSGRLALDRYGKPQLTGYKHVEAAMTGSITINQIGAVLANAGGASGITSGDLVGTRGVTVTQNGDVTATSTNSANGFGVNVRNATSTSGNVSISTTTGKSIKATSGTATGINVTSVTAGNTFDAYKTLENLKPIGTNPNSKITLTNNANVTGLANSAYGLYSGRVELVASSAVQTAETPAITVTNTGVVTASQNLAKLTAVEASGIHLTSEVKTGGTTNNASIVNSGNVTANNLADNDGLKTTAVENKNRLLSEEKAKAATTYSYRNRTIKIGTKTYDLSIKSQAATAYGLYLAANQLTTAKVDDSASAILGYKNTLLAGKNVTATGVVMGGGNVTGSLTIRNSGAVSHGSNDSTLNYTIAATGVDLKGYHTSGGDMAITNSGTVTGVSGAIGVNEVGVGGLKSTQALSITSNKTVSASTISGTATSVKLTSSVIGKSVSITQSGDVTANTAYGIYESNTYITSTMGNVSLSSSDAVTGTTLAAGIQLSPYSPGVYNASKRRTDYYPAAVVSTTGGDISLNQSGEIKALSGSASGITAAMLTSAVGITITQNGSVTGSSTATTTTGSITTANTANGVSLTNDVTAGASVKVDQTGTVTGGGVANGIELKGVVKAGTASSATPIYNSQKKLTGYKHVEAAMTGSITI